MTMWKFHWWKIWVASFPRNKCKKTFYFYIRFVPGVTIDHSASSLNLFIFVFPLCVVLSDFSLSNFFFVGNFLSFLIGWDCVVKEFACSWFEAE